MRLLPADLEALAEFNAGTTRARREYRACPQTHHTPIAGPCIRGCGRTAFTVKGVCRSCLRDNKGN